MQHILPLFIAIVFATPLVLAQPIRPDQGLTPGSLCDNQDKDFSGYRYKERIAYCERAVTPAMRRQVYDLYKVPENKRREYTIDHYIPLSIGGDNDISNLWPEPIAIKNLRFNLEWDVYNELQASRINQRQAINYIMRAKLNPPVRRNN